MEKNSNVCKESVFQGLFDSISQELHNFIYYKFGKDNNPEDLVQEAFIKLWDNCHKVSLENARGFLFTVANNLSLNAAARAKTALNYRISNPSDDTDKESPHYQLELNEFDGRLKNALENLPEDQRTTFLMNRIDGLKHKEIAERLGISQKAVEKRIYTALKKLKDELGNI
jgi:RNA polymerase sigma-70 factor (ECF subfamily)